MCRVALEERQSNLLVQDNYFDNEADMNIYVIGGHQDSRMKGFQVWNGEVKSPFANATGGAHGVADPENQVLFIQGNFSRSGNLESWKESQIGTIAHEVGHNLVGPGHPDQNAGPAPLPNTFHPYRLMISSGNRPDSPNLMVKGEWDQAEATLNRLKGIRE